MKCPYCENLEDKVIDSRISPDGQVTRRRRECLKCHGRFTTYEHIENFPLMVIKRDNRREPFDKNKLLAGLRKACEKRPIAIETLEQIADEAERILYKGLKREIKTTRIGKLIMRRLQALDEVAYVRFASVYRQFKDARQFLQEAENLVNFQRHRGTEAQRHKVK